MASLNKVMLIGNLGSDPEIRYTASQTPVANFNIATSERWTDKTSGERKESTEWHRIIVWGKQAEHCKEYLRKGSSVYVEGRLQTRSWDDQNGQKRYTTEVVANTVTFLGGRGSSDEGGSYGGGGGGYGGGGRSGGGGGGYGGGGRSGGGGGGYGGGRSGGGSSGGFDNAPPPPEIDDGDIPF